jgi:hypothetical protein
MMGGVDEGDNYIGYYWGLYPHEIDEQQELRPCCEGRHN